MLEQLQKLLFDLEYIRDHHNEMNDKVSEANLLFCIEDLKNIY